MAALDLDEPRLFAPAKKRKKHAPKAATKAAESDTVTVRRNPAAGQQSTPTPTGLASLPSRRSCEELQPQDAAELRDSSRGGDGSLTPFFDGSGAVDDAAATDTVVLASAAAAAPTFRSLGVSEWLDRVCRSLGMMRPTGVQTGCIPAILAGRNAIGTAHTGSGKTAAFALPILQLLAADPFGVFALVLTPTRCLPRLLLISF